MIPFVEKFEESKLRKKRIIGMNTVAVVKDLDILELNCKAVSD